jgi:hypothetical protein
MLQYSIATPIIEDDVAIENIVCEVLLKLPILYLPHMFEILNYDSWIDHRWSKSYQNACLQAINEKICLWMGIN